ncbi:DUF4407 domain-containing protein [Bradyrhizobium sp. CCGUVB4N]|uniref:DUF4407 domain-containing protein n=1 Tax=Bradyrhizobium sp. CCGUVB4N TaxID=2949631 RepID=UPI0020B18995|nr:DUF4407 domain-containing protein [Bradyrhizobium sp. CCGUVB4N]MCP3381248.1 DUF4407 domain-containing protein [Bradyrhizobium sp. CCGUVB4N]
MHPNPIFYDPEPDETAGRMFAQPARLGLISRVLVTAGGGTPSELARHASSNEIGTFMSRGLMSIGSMIGMGAGLSVVTNTLFNPGGQWSWSLTAIGASAALFVGVTDVYCFYRAPLYRQGIKELKKAGLRTTALSGHASTMVTLFRVGQAVATSATVALFVSMMGYAGDITAKIESDYLSENKPIVARVTPVYEAAVMRATRAVNDQAALTRAQDVQIGSLQQNVIRAAVRGSRNAKAASTAATDNGAAQLATLEAKRTAEYARLDSLKADLDRLNRDHNKLIQQAVDTSSDRKPKRDGFLGRLTAFTEILHESWLRVAVVAALEAIAFGIEIAPILAHWIYVPSSTAAAMALDHLRRTTALARQAATLFEPDEPPPESPTGGNPKPEPGDPEPPAPEPRRKRGRPRKVPLNGHQPPPLA